MSDREMLELAAESIGLPECGWMADSFMYVKDNTWAFWNPLEDDGDALRLAVDLHLFDTGRFREFRLQEVRNDPTRSDYEITRRAITRAAAAIGAEIQRNRGAA